MAKMKYSEIPRDLSSDSVAAFRLAQVCVSYIICDTYSFVFLLFPLIKVTYQNSLKKIIFLFLPPLENKDNLLHGV